jgi:hypothetical protein
MPAIDSIRPILLCQLVIDSFIWKAVKEVWTPVSTVTYFGGVKASLKGKLLFSGILRPALWLHEEEGYIWLFHISQFLEIGQLELWNFAQWEVLSVVPGKVLLVSRLTSRLPWHLCEITRGPPPLLFAASMLHLILNDRYTTGVSSHYIMDPVLVVKTTRIFNWSHENWMDCQ